MTDSAHTNQHLTDIESFLDRHLPHTGHRCIAHHSNSIFSSTFYPDNHRAVTKAVALDASGHGEVYFACAVYVDPSLGRKGYNVWAARSFWLDIDTRESKPDAPYADKAEAEAALATFCCEVGLPSPTLVDSGNGLHVYWPMCGDQTSDEWRRVANLLKSAIIKAGLKVDPSRTTDIASVLRVPGTHNRKDPENTRPVRLLYLGEPTKAANFQAALTVYAKAEAASGRGMRNGSNLGNDLMVNPDYRPSDAFRIAEHCAVIKHIRDTRGNVSEPLWYAGMGVLVHTTQSDAVCHDWSRGHPGYDEDETQGKIDRLKSYGPTTCVHLRAHSDGLCLGCPYGDGA